MHYFLRIAVCASTFFLASYVFAEAKQNVCPPLSMVAKVKFITAELMYSNDKTLWGMRCDSFDYREGQWEVDYDTRLPHANTPEKALEQCQEFFNTQAVLSKAKPMYPAPGYISCEYAYVDDGYNGYVVQANYPSPMPRLHSRLHS